MNLLKKQKTKILAAAFVLLLSSINFMPVHAEPESDPETTESGGTETALSSNARLASLSISGATLNPSFSSHVTGYTAVLLADETSITIEAAAEDENAVVTGTGYFDVSYDEEEQEFTVTCEAEDGSVLQYTIIVTYSSDPVLFTALGGQNLGFVIKDLDKLKAPDGFAMQEGSYQGSKIITFVNANFDFSLVYLQNDTKKADWYCYQDGVVTSPFRTLVINKNKYYYAGVKESDRSISGYSYGEINVVGEKINGWKVSGDENYVMMYLYDSNGQGDYYVYDLESQTLQNRREFEVGHSKSQKSFLLSPVVIAAAIVLLVALAFVIMIVGANKKRTLKETFMVVFHRLKNGKAEKVSQQDTQNQDLVELVRTSKVRIFAHPDEIATKQQKTEPKTEAVSVKAEMENELTKPKAESEMKTAFAKPKINEVPAEASEAVAEAEPEEKKRKPRKSFFKKKKAATVPDNQKSEVPVIEETQVSVNEELKPEEKTETAVNKVPVTAEVEIPQFEEEVQETDLYEEDPMTEIQKYIDQLFYLSEDKQHKKEDK